MGSGDKIYRLGENEGIKLEITKTKRWIQIRCKNE